MRIWRRKKVDDKGCIGRNRNVLYAVGTAIVWLDSMRLGNDTKIEAVEF